MIPSHQKDTVQAVSAATAATTVSPTAAAIASESICKHMNFINPLEDPKFFTEKFKRFITDLQARKLPLNPANEIHECTSNPEEWICLHEGCESVFLRKPNDPYSILQHIDNVSSEEEKHCLFINCQSTEIRCIDCQQEIFDIPMYSTSKNEEIIGWNNPRKIRDIFHHDQFDWDCNLLRSNLSNPKSHWKSSKGLCGLTKSSNASFMNAIFQILSNIPLLRKVFKKMNRIYGALENVSPRSPARRVSFFFTKLLAAMWSGQHRVTDPEELQNALYQMEPSLRGYQFKDAYDFFKKFTNILHEDFKFISKKVFDMKKTTTTEAQNLVDEWEIINNVKDYCDFSMISTTFKGKLCVRAQCSLCKQVYWCEEDFTGVSLDVPSKEWKSKKDNWGFETKKSIEKPVKESGIFSKIFTSKPTNSSTKTALPQKRTLNECLAYFCENSVLQEKKLFYCDDCKMKVSVTKNSNFLTLPNVLCIQFNRFQTGGNPLMKNSAPVDFPIDNLDMSYFMKAFEVYDQSLTQYELSGVVEHIDSYGGGNNYVTYARNAKNNLFYKFSDSQFKTFDMAACKDQIQPYMLFYKLKAKGENALLRNLTSQIQLLKSGDMTLDPKRSAYLPCFWFEKLKYLANPGIVSSQHLLCPHAKIKPDFFDCFPPKQARSADSLLLAENSALDPTMILDMSSDQPLDLEPETNYAIQFLKIQSVIVPKEIASYLVDHYGGGPLIDGNLQICTDCIRIARNIRKRRKIEKELIAKYDKKFTEETYIVDETWMNKWKDFLYSNKKFFKRNFVKGLPSPGLIDNKQLLGPSNVLKQGLKRNVNFRIVNDYIWQIFKKLYGGGPALVINDFNSRKKNYTKPSLPQSDLDLIQEMVLLLDEKKYNEVMKNILTDDLTQNNNPNSLHALKKPPPSQSPLLPRQPQPQMQARQGRSNSIVGPTSNSVVTSIHPSLNRASSIDYSSHSQSQNLNPATQSKLNPYQNQLINNMKPPLATNSNNVTTATASMGSISSTSNTSASLSKPLELSLEKIKL